MTALTISSIRSIDIVWRGGVVVMLEEDCTKTNKRTRTLLDSMEVLLTGVALEIISCVGK